MSGIEPGSSSQKQTTIQNEVSSSGKGLFTGENVSLKILPAPANSGITFQRVDLPGKPLIPARLKFVREVPRCTRLATESASIHMVEHLLAALKGMGVDNAHIEVNGPEILAADGSSRLFVELIEKAKIISLDAPRKVIKITKPIYWSKDEVHLVALPSEEFRVSYTMHYPQSKLLRSQYYTLVPSPEAFKAEIASCRTFSLYEEILPFIDKGIIKGGGLENALVIRGDQVMNPEGVRFPDEPVRHKVLDLIGDFNLLGVDIQGHIISVRSGHSSNIQFAKMIENSECGHARS